MTPDSTNTKSLIGEGFIFLTLFNVDEAIPQILWGRG